MNDKKPFNWNQNPVEYEVKRDHTPQVQVTAYLNNPSLKNWLDHELKYEGINNNSRSQKLGKTLEIIRKVDDALQYEDITRDLDYKIGGLIEEHFFLKDAEANPETKELLEQIKKILKAEDKIKEIINNYSKREEEE